MGLFRSIRHAVKKIGHVAEKATKAFVSGNLNLVKYAVRPDKAVKDVIRDPFGTIAKVAGLDKLFSAGGAPTTQLERGQVAATSSYKEELSAQDRQRMISRQGMQGANPIMLLGQDYTPDNLDRDQELGGDRV